ncbi:uncharacterized protein [Dysidea avara]|uniref:uncharacterized protein n=1 Tax=Dysidea avara TaxID=196820 RepID=UPI00331CA954
MPRMVAERQRRPGSLVQHGTITRNIFRLNPRRETFSSRIGVETQVLLIFSKTTKCTMNRVTYEMEIQGALHRGMRNLYKHLNYLFPYCTTHFINIILFRLNERANVALWLYALWITYLLNGCPNKCKSGKIASWL